MSIFALLFSFTGRIGRLAYAGILIGTIFVPPLVTIMVAAFIGLPVPHTLVEFQAIANALRAPLAVLNLVVFWIGLAAAVKRLHDLGRSGWVQAKLALALVIVFGVLGFAAALKSTPGIVAGAMLALIATLYSFWIAIQMLFFAGDGGMNDYGPPGGQASEPRLPPRSLASPRRSTPRASARRRRQASDDAARSESLHPFLVGPAFCSNDQARRVTPPARPQAAATAPRLQRAPSRARRVVARAWLPPAHCARKRRARRAPRRRARAAP